MIRQAIVLAGGLGTRLRSAVKDVPKPMAPIQGVPFLELLLRYWRRQGVERFILSVGYKAEIIEQHFGNHFEGATVEYAVEQMPLGTGGALMHAFSKLAPCETFLFLNGDTFFEVPVDALQSFHSLNDSDVTFSLFRPSQNTRYSGLPVLPDGRITEFRSQGASQDPLVNAGVYLFNTEFLKTNWVETPPALSLESQLFSAWLQRGARFYGKEFAGRFIDIGIPEDYHKAHTVLDRSLWTTT